MRRPKLQLICSGLVKQGINCIFADLFHPFIKKEKGNRKEDNHFCTIGFILDAYGIQM